MLHSYNALIRSANVVVVLLLTCLTICCPVSSAFGVDDPMGLEPTELTSLSLEALLNLNVTSVSRKPQKLANAAAAIFVINQEDIRRSGATSIAEALRMAPGVQVGQMSANKWAVSIRGINGRFSNKLLVLMDGRTLYNPLFSGVYWEVQDTVMEDIDRIEVIRGPSAALWGANAVNGVINITTKSAKETVGGLVSTGGGTEERGFGTIRYGTVLGKDTALKLYAKHQDHDSGGDANSHPAQDAWRMTRGGFRADSNISSRDIVTVQGDYYDGKLGESYTLYHLPTASEPTNSQVVDSQSLMSGGNILSRWQRTLADNEALSLQIFYDHSERDMIILGEKRDIVDIDFQHRFSLGKYQDIVWGLGYRYNHDFLGDTPYITFPDAHEQTDLYSSFVHDEISLIPDRLALILGSRFEHNSYTGFEVQPNGRLLWTPSAQHTFWGAVARAVRTPARGDRGIAYRYGTVPANTPPLNPDPLRPMLLQIEGASSFKSETLLAYEVGYRTEPLPRVSLDIAAFYNVYDQLRVRGTSTTTSSANSITAHQPLINGMHGYSEGIEVSAEWLPMSWWRLLATYSYLKLTMSLDATSTDTVNKGDAEGDSPTHQFSIRSGFDLGKQVELDFWLRGADRVAYIDGESIPGYLTMDTRLAWKPRPQLELALVGRNLFHQHRKEFAPEFVNTFPTEVERSFYGKVTWQF
jgi:iron complex outermembrane receptor protein